MVFPALLGILVGLLGHPDFRVRNSAHQTLAIINCYFGPLKVLKYGFQSPDTEVRRRTEKILRDYVEAQGLPEIRYLPMRWFPEKDGIQRRERYIWLTLKKVRNARQRRKLPPISESKLEQQATLVFLKNVEGRQRLKKAQPWDSDLSYREMLENKFQALKKQVIEGK